MPLGPAGECLNFALQIPELLQRYDALDLRCATAMEEIQTLMSDCRLLYGDFRQWHIALQQSASGPGGAAYTTLNVEMFPTYAALVSDRTLSAGFRFARPNIAFLCLHYWCSTYF